MLLKSSRNKKDFNDVTAAPFLVFFAAGSWAKNTENGAAVISLRSFLFHDDFNYQQKDQVSGTYLSLRGLRDANKEYVTL